MPSPNSRRRNSRDCEFRNLSEENFIRPLILALISFQFISLSSFGEQLKIDRTFTFRVRDEPQTLDWNRAHSTVEENLLNNIMEGLVSFGPGNTVIPALAESWQVSPDGKTYTYKLRPNIKWSDGVPLKAQDFIYSWRRLLSPLTGAAYAYLLFEVRGAEDFYKGTIKNFEETGMKALSDSELQIQLNRAAPFWKFIPAFWCTFPLRQDIVAKYGSAWETPGKMVNLGPYSVVSHDYNSKIVLKANPYYYGSRGNINQAIGLMIPRDQDAYPRYQSGELDSLNEFSNLKLTALEKTELQTFPQFKTGYLGFVVDRYPLSDVKVRRAIGMAIDKTKLVTLLHEGQQVANSFVPPGIDGYSDKIGLPYNPAQAKRELQASGMDVSHGYKLDYLLPNWDKPAEIANQIQSDLSRNLGFQVELKPVDNKSYRAQLDLRSYRLFDATWTADYPDPDNFLSVFSGNSGNNTTNWKNAKYEDGIFSARQIPDPEKRKNLYLNLQQILLEDEAVIIPLYYEPNKALVKPRVKNFYINPVNIMYLKNIELK